MERHLKLKLPQGKFLNVSASRSRMMSAIRGKNTRSTERALRSALMRAGIKGWRLHPDHVLGKPDLYFPKHRIAIFVDGCFWHFCPKCGHIPKTRQAFWKAKIERNKRRDQRIKRFLTRTGINVIRIWEHELGSETKIVRVITKITAKLSSIDLRTQRGQQNHHRKI
jgi:DNA mismatch endonuclease (patch repair protein)